MITFLVPICLLIGTLGSLTQTIKKKKKKDSDWHIISDIDLQLEGCWFKSWYQQYHTLVPKIPSSV